MRLNLKNRYILLVTTVVVIIVLSLVVFLFSKTKTITELSNLLFIISTIIGSIGFIIAITSKSRRHYHKHLHKKTKGEDVDEEAFELDLARRTVQASYGVTIGVAGVFGGIISFIVTVL